jgi:hypothetical protein
MELQMKTGVTVTILGIWFAVVGALFATAGSADQWLVGVIGLVCAFVATFLIVVTSPDEKAPENEPSKKEAEPVNSEN